ncbi:DUF4429 domain-containing protein [Streptomyces sp. NPDC048659]|uniref:DUF4429 domain-containing protein n=1 Tax=Streptomyces sp. NPDC048659 TaxID=3155489 RepID=UPI003426BD02
MGDVLAGIHATWQFESDAIVIRFERGIRTPRLFGTLRERRIPHEALASVTLTPGKRGTLVLRAVPRAGADPLVEAAAGQLTEGGDPYRLVLPAEREPQAAYYRDELLGLLPADATEPADGFLVAAPEGPQSFKAYDGKASFDGSGEVSFRWSRTMASSEKWRAGDQVFAVRELNGVEWRSPEAPEGFLRLLTRPDPCGSARLGEHPDRDPASVVFGLGYGPVHESLPFAAAVLAAIRGSGRAIPAQPGAARPYDPAGVEERIRHLGELHQAGLVTDEEFSCRKAELLAEL